LTVLRAEFVRAGGAAERFVRLFPKAFGMEECHKLPEDENHERQQKQASSKETRDEHERGEHHEMIPVEDAAGGAAARLHQKTERTPDQHADQITHIEQHRNEKEFFCVQNPPIVQQPNDRKQRDPDQHDLIGCFRGGNGISFQCGKIDLLLDGLKPL